MTSAPGAVVAAGAALLLLSGCQGSERPGPTGAEPGPTVTYDEEEVAVYRRAVRRVEEFEVENQKILSAGEATEEASRFYRRRLRAWRSSYALLQSYERRGIRIARRPVVLSTTATSIKSFQDNAAEVVLERCTDQSDLGMTRNGVPVPAAHDEPVIQQVTVYRSENRTWTIGRFTTTDRPCGP